MASKIRCLSSFLSEKYYVRVEGIAKARGSNTTLSFGRRSFWTFPDTPLERGSHLLRVTEQMRDAARV